VGQVDFIFDIVWNGYTLGLVGVQLWRWVNHAWKPYMCPLVWVMALEEEHRAISLALEACSLLLLREGARREVLMAMPLFVQMHADFKESAKKAVKHYPGTRLVNDLEHMFRALGKHGGLRARPLSVVKTYLGFSALLPTGLLFHCYWKVMREHMRVHWKEQGWATYLFQEYFRETPNGQIQATWWMGLTSPIRKGHPASQNIIESCVSRLRRSIQAAQRLHEVKESLNKLETTFERYCCTPGTTYSICGPHQEHTFVPSSAGKASEDLLHGPGRRTSVGGVNLHYPTASHIMESFHRSGG